MKKLNSYKITLDRFVILCYNTFKVKESNKVLNKNNYKGEYLWKKI